MAEHWSNTGSQGTAFALAGASKNPGAATAGHFACDDAELALAARDAAALDAVAARGRQRRARAVAVLANSCVRQGRQSSHGPQPRHRNLSREAP